MPVNEVGKETAARTEVAAKPSAAEANVILDSEGKKVAEDSTEAHIVGEGIDRQVETGESATLEFLKQKNEVDLKTRNEELDGTNHPETDVPFKKEVVILPDGTIVEGVFPEFLSEFDAHLPTELNEASHYQQAKWANEQLKQGMESDPELKAKFDERQLEQIGADDTPDGYTWHHHQEPGRMQLVDTEVHMKTGHTGGKEIWGGGR